MLQGSIHRLALLQSERVRRASLNRLGIQPAIVAQVKTGQHHTILVSVQQGQGETLITPCRETD
jgi:hypothetical protein